MMRALLVYAHADDEIIFGYPFLFDPGLECRILICANDATNPQRGWCRLQAEALAAVCQGCGVTKHHILPFHSEFSRLPSRAAEGPLLKDWWAAASHQISELSRGCDFIATHNPWGEYGHLDHLLVRRAVLESGVGLPVKWTTARYVTKTWPIGDTSKFVETPPPALKDFWKTLDVQRYEALKAHYTARGCFTWDNPVPSPVCIVEQ